MKKTFILSLILFTSTSIVAGIYHHKLRTIQKRHYRQAPAVSEEKKQPILRSRPYRTLSHKPQIQRKKQKTKDIELDFENFLKYELEDDIDVTNETKEDKEVIRKPLPIQSKKQGKPKPELIGDNIVVQQNDNLAFHSNDTQVDREVFQESQDDEQAWVKQFVKQSKSNPNGEEVILWVEASNKYPEVRFYAKFIFDSVEYDRKFTFTWNPKEFENADVRKKVVEIPQYQGSVFDYRFIANHYEDFKQGKLIRDGVWVIKVKDEEENELISADYKIPTFEEAKQNEE